ncbi:gag-Pol polyprotein [Trichonephila clavipes]|nr:gag-Pol polyprotein [Trichonephila clavipes]
MIFRRDLRLPADLLFSRPPDAPLAPEEYIEKLQALMEKMHHLARERIGMTSEKMKTGYDARATRHDFHEGDKVWLWNPKRRKGFSPKQQNKWEGTYLVLKRLNDVVVRIQKSPHSKPKVRKGISETTQEYFKDDWSNLINPDELADKLDAYENVRKGTKIQPPPEHDRMIPI